MELAGIVIFGAVIVTLVLTGSEGTRGGRLAAEIVVGSLTIASMLLVFIGFAGLFADGSGPIFAFAILLVALPLYVFFAVMWFKTHNRRKELRQAGETDLGGMSDESSED